MISNNPIRRIKRCIASNLIYLLGGCIVLFESIYKIWTVEAVTDIMGYILLGELSLGVIMIALSFETILRCMSQLKLNETNEFLKELFKK